MSNLWLLAFVLLWLFVLVEGVAILALARALGLLQLRLGPEPAALRTTDGLAVDAEAPSVGGFDMRLKRSVTLDVSQGRWGLVFVGATCGNCREVLRAAGRVDKDRGWGARVVVVAQGSHEQNEVLSELAPNLVLLSDPDGQVHRAYGVEHTPFAFLVEEGRVRAKGVVNHRDHLEALLDRQMTERPDAVWTPINGDGGLVGAHASTAARER